MSSTILAAGCCCPEDETPSGCPGIEQAWVDCLGFFPSAVQVSGALHTTFFQRGVCTEPPKYNVFCTGVGVHSTELRCTVSGTLTRAADCSICGELDFTLARKEQWFDQTSCPPFGGDNGLIVDTTTISCVVPVCIVPVAIGMNPPVVGGSLPVTMVQHTVYSGSACQSPSTPADCNIITNHTADLRLSASFPDCVASPGFMTVRIGAVELCQLRGVSESINIGSAGDGQGGYCYSTTSNGHFTTTPIAIE